MSETIRLLHVEDLASDAELIWRELWRAGLAFEPVRVEEEGTFLDRLRSLEPDIILSDYSLPHFNGMRALELAREHAPDVPVIIVTGSQNEETAVACMRAGAADYVIKEYLSRLPSAIDSALRHRKLDTLRHEAEQSLRKSEQQLLQAQKMEAVGRLAGGVAHDFNNILMAIMLQGNALVRLAAGNERMVKSVEEILKAGQRAATLTKQLLAFSRNDEASPKVLSPQAVVHNLRDMLQRLVSEDVAVTFELDRKCSNVYADGGQLEQVVMNLVINARDAMPRGGEIRMEVRNAIPAEVDSAGGVSGTPYAILSVSDTGVGMDSVTVQRIFEPFFTTKPKDKGTGLGLSIVYGIVTRAGGLIRVSSELGRGTTFNVFIPTVEHDADRPAVVDSQATEKDLRGTETILLVEDDLMVRRLLSATLEANGYTVLQASDGAEALEVARKASPIDILLTDVVMPTVNGVEVARAIAASRPSVRVILMSGYADDVITSYGLDASDAVLLHKPFTEDRLLTAVRSALGPVAR